MEVLHQLHFACTDVQPVYEECLHDLAAMLGLNDPGKPDMRRDRSGYLAMLTQAPRQGHCVLGLLLITAVIRSCGRRLARRVARAMLVSPLAW
jgi:hypothetical protein